MRHVEAGITESHSPSKSLEQAGSGVEDEEAPAQDAWLNDEVEAGGSIPVGESAARDSQVAGDAREVGAGRGPGGDRVVLEERCGDRRMAGDRERLAFRYIQGMERGDDELIGEVLGLAVADDQLWEMIEGINQQYQVEEGLL